MTCSGCESMLNRHEFEYSHVTCHVEVNEIKLFKVPFAIVITILQKSPLQLLLKDIEDILAIVAVKG